MIQIIAFTLLVFFSCAHNGEWAKRVVWEELDFAVLPGDEDYPNADAIILLDQGKMEIFGSKEMDLSVFERHRIVKILNACGQRYANIAIPYSSRSQVGKIRARTISPEGKITVLDKKNIFDVNLYPNFVFYSDQRAKLFTMPAIGNGSVIEYRYQVNIRNLTFWHSWGFQEEVPTLISRYTLVGPSELEVNYQVYGIDLEPRVAEAPQGFKSKYVWEARDVPALKSEIGMPPQNKLIAHLTLAPIGIETWQDVAEWYYELAAPQMKAGRGVKELSSALTCGVENDEDKLRLVYEWIRDQLRYIAVSIGIGGYQPHPAEEVLVNRYGDCKDMTTLLCSVLRESGLEAYEVLVSTWQNGMPDTSLPSPFQFNHVIAYCPSVGDSGVWMDATNKGCPYGKLPWYDQGLPVLIVGKEGEAEILTTPSEPPDSNRVLLDWQVKLLSTGAGTVQGKTYLWGAFATELRDELYYMSADARKQWLETYLAKRCSGVKLDSFQIEGLYPVRDPLIISYNFYTSTFAIPRSGEMVFRSGSILAFDLPDYFRSQSRVHPIRLRFGSQMELNLTVDLPNDWVVNIPASSDSLVSSFGSAFWSCFAIDGVFQYNSNYCLLRKDVSPQDYHDFQNFLDSIREKNLHEMVITKKKNNI